MLTQENLKPSFAVFYPAMNPGVTIKIRPAEIELRYANAHDSKMPEQLAKLYAASPDLLEACETALRLLVEQPTFSAIYGDSDLVIQSLKKAIKNAYC